MKVYTKIVIDMETLETIEEDSYEYEGPVAQCGGGGKGGGGSKVEYEQSPEQRQMYQQILPIVQRLSNSAQTGQSLYNIPSAPQYPTLPSASGVYSSVPQSQIANYNIPSASSMMPTGDWYSNLSPEVMAGINAPWDDAQKQLQETMGAAGTSGSASAGYSGAAGAALGEFYADKANSVGLQAWNMVSPALQSEWGAQLGQNQWLAQQQTLQNAAARGELTQENMMNYQNSANQLLGNYDTGLQSWQQQIAMNQMPYSILPGLAGGTYSTPIVNNQTNPLAGGLMGGLMGYGMGQQMNANPYVTGGMGAGAGILSKM